MDIGGNVRMSDEDEDLEALRLAALQTLHRKKCDKIQPEQYFNPNVSLVVGSNTGITFAHKHSYINGGQNKGLRKAHHHRFFGNRGGHRNGHKAGVCNSNLITIPVIEDTHDGSKRKAAQSDAPKLVLPQDRYYSCSSANESKLNGESETASRLSKFDRHRSDSEQSEEDDDVETKRHISPVQGFQRSGSLDALMDELEREINGVPPTEVSTDEPSTAPLTESVNLTSMPPVLTESAKKESKFSSPLSPPLKNDTKVVTSPSAPPQQPSLQPPPQLPTPPLSVTASCNRVPRASTPPPTAAIMAPLSPRSAAFVLQNQAIIERRKRRPSVSSGESRSSSPEDVRMRTRRLSRTPPLPKRSRKTTPPRKIRPLHRSSARTSDRRCPTDTVSNKKTSRTPPIPVTPAARNNRMVVAKQQPSLNEEKNGSVLEARRRKFERSDIIPKEGIIKLNKRVEPEVTKPLPYNDAAASPKLTTEEENRKDDEDLLLEAMDIELTDGETTCDDESSDSLSLVHELSHDSEAENAAVKNEIHFKSSTDARIVRETTVVTNRKRTLSMEKDRQRKRSIEKDLNSTKLSRTTKANDASTGIQHYPDQSSLSRCQRSDVSKSHRLRVRSSTNSSTSKLLSNRNRKIEIKIRNPAKYERNTMCSSVKSDVGAKSSDEHTSRSEEVSSDPDEMFEEMVADVRAGKKLIPSSHRRRTSARNLNTVPIIGPLPENEQHSAHANPALLSDGDLRAQLSRRRAERKVNTSGSLNQPPFSKNVGSRLLQDALQEAIYKQQNVRHNAQPQLSKVTGSIRSVSVSSIVNDDSDMEDNNQVTSQITKVSSDSKKLPIHLRLGTVRSRSHVLPPLMSITTHAHSNVLEEDENEEKTNLASTITSTSSGKSSLFVKRSRNRTGPSSTISKLRKRKKTNKGVYVK